MTAVALLVLAAIVSTVLAIVRAGRRDSRLRALAALASRLGLDYAAVDVLNDAWQPFRLFGLGVDRGVEHVISGTFDGGEVHAFDYWYREEDRSRLPLGDGALAPVRRFSCAWVSLPASCPRLVVERRDLADHLLELVGGDLVELDLDAFNHRFAVRSEDRRFAVALLDQRMMEALLALPASATVAVAEDRLLLISRQLPAEGVERLLRAASDLKGRVPRVLSSLYPLRPGFRPGDAPVPDGGVMARGSAEGRDTGEDPGLWWF